MKFHSTSMQATERKKEIHSPLLPFFFLPHNAPVVTENCISLTWQTHISINPIDCAFHNAMILLFLFPLTQDFTLNLLFRHERV
jgi:hypothetical protein